VEGKKKTMPGGGEKKTVLGTGGGGANLPVVRRSLEKIGGDD